MSNCINFPVKGFVEIREIQTSVRMFLHLLTALLSKYGTSEL
uniref:Uncharacterized protein n=1 Tax=Anguilla anguilla TaxID=7936 RepID=A0A0E9TQP8_ANGAN